MPEGYTRARNVFKADEVMTYRLAQNDKKPDWEGLFNTMRTNRNKIPKKNIVKSESTDENAVSFNRYEEIFE